MIPAPRIDSRTASDIEQQLRALLNTYAPGWKASPGDFGEALVRIFARYAEIVIERLNRTPDKNLLAYLDLLGASLLPPQPARVPLTFSLAAGSTADGEVPAATQVAAPPAEGDTAPLIFETERELAVVAATLDKIFACEPGTDSFTDLSRIHADGRRPARVPDERSITASTSVWTVSSVAVTCMNCASTSTSLPALRGRWTCPGRSSMARTGHRPSRWRTAGQAKCRSGRPATPPAASLVPA